MFAPPQKMSQNVFQRCVLREWSQHGGELWSRGVLMRSSGLRPGLPSGRRKKTRNKVSHYRVESPKKVQKKYERRRQLHHPLTTRKHSSIYTNSQNSPHTYIMNSQDQNRFIYLRRTHNIYELPELTAYIYNELPGSKPLYLSP